MEKENAATKSRRGKARSGRKKKGQASSSALPSLVFEAALAALPPDDIRVEARKYASLAIEVLGSIATHGAGAVKRDDLGGKRNRSH